MLFNASNADLKHFFQATQSLTSFIYVAKRLVTHMKKLLLHGRGINVISGNALATRLGKTALDLGIPILTRSPAQEIVMENGKATGVRVAAETGEYCISAKHGVVLACGGFIQRIAKAYPHGRGRRRFGRIRFQDSEAWMPVSRVPYANGEFGVLRNGQRFTNESNSYHDVGAAMIRACESQTETAMWLVCDKTAIAKYGLGYAKPAPCRWAS